MALDSKKASAVVSLYTKSITNTLQKKYQLDSRVQPR
jgi:hypothetical protein